MKSPLFFILLIFLSGCNQPANKGKPAEEKTHTAITKIPIPAVDTVFAGEGDTTILIKNGGVFIKGRIVANKAQPKYSFSLLKGQSVTAVIKCLKKGGNVRINQIQRPDGSFDGPFGDSLNYTFSVNGKISLIIGENLMAGDPYTGDFILHVKVSGL